MSLVSGRHLINWCAADAEGNSTCDTQTVDITPLVSFDANEQLTAEGVTVSVLISLSGNPVSYPATIPVLLGDASTALNPADHDATTQTLMINEDDPEDDLPANTARLQFATVDDGVTGEANETVVLRLVENNGEESLAGAALGAEASLTHTVIITEENVPPTVTITSRDEVTLSGSVATGTVRISDPNQHDEYLVSWYLDGSLIASGTNLTEVQYDISEITAGEHTLRVTALDSGDPALEGEDDITVTFEAPPVTLANDSSSGGFSLALLVLLAVGCFARQKAGRIRPASVMTR